MKNILLILLLVGVSVGIYFYNQKQETPTVEEPKEEMTQQKETVVEEKTYTDLTPEEAKNLLDKNPNVIVIDVSPKYAEGHLPNAIGYYVGDGSLDAAIPSLDPEATYLVYCHIDSASIEGATKLVEAGFKNVYRLAGNYAAWVEAGYPIE